MVNTCTFPENKCVMYGLHTVYTHLISLKFVVNQLPVDIYHSLYAQKRIFVRVLMKHRSACSNWMKIYYKDATNSHHFLLYLLSKLREFLLQGNGFLIPPLPVLSNPTIVMLKVRQDSHNSTFSKSLLWFGRSQTRDLRHRMRAFYPFSYPF